MFGLLPEYSVLQNILKTLSSPGYFIHSAIIPTFAIKDVPSLVTNGHFCRVWALSHFGSEMQPSFKRFLGVF